MKKYAYVSLCAGILALLSTIGCAAPREINVVKSSTASDKSQLMNEVLKVLVEEGYGDQVRFVEATDNQMAIDMLNSGKADVMLELDSSTGLTGKAQAFGPLFEDDSSVKAVGAALAEKSPEILELVKKMSAPASRKKRALNKAITWMTENKQPYTAASVKALDNMRSEWELWVDESTRNRINTKMNKTIKELEKKGVTF